MAKTAPKPPKLTEEQQAKIAQFVEDVTKAGLVTVDLELPGYTGPVVRVNDPRIVSAATSIPVTTAGHEGAIVVFPALTIRD